MKAKPKVCTKSGEWIELNEEEIKLRSNYDKDGKKLDSLAENPDLIKQWTTKLDHYNRSLIIEDKEEVVEVKDKVDEIKDEPVEEVEAPVKKEVKKEKKAKKVKKPKKTKKGDKK